MQCKQGRQRKMGCLYVAGGSAGASRVTSPQSWCGSREITAQKRRAQAKTQPSSGRSDPFPEQPSSERRAAHRDQGAAGGHQPHSRQHGYLHSPK